jgi:hypothetical protein
MPIITGTPLATAVVKVTVTDVNDNAPVFERPLYNVSLKTLTAAEAAAVMGWLEIAVVRATDADSGVCGQVFYVIVGGNDDGLFVIDQRTGDGPTTHST